MRVQRLLIALEAEAYHHQNLSTDDALKSKRVVLRQCLGGQK